MAKTIFHPANQRGVANHGWLKSFHSFSFAHYYDPSKIHFGALRVLNDDEVAPGAGFGTHPHDNMEIISIPLEGDLEHKDSMGNVAIIKQGDVQVMSAGSGITHSEHNKNKDKLVKFLQIWVIPKEKNVTPRYGQVSLKLNETKNNLINVVSPNKEETEAWIHQDAWFYMGKFDAEKTIDYTLNKTNNGVYIFVLDGAVAIENQLLEKRDAIGIWETESVNIKVKKDNTELLIMEVPMHIN